MEQAKRVIALGFFDGVHLGHAALLKTAVKRAAELDAVPAALTFDRHPDEVILSGSRTPLINSAADREGLMRRLYGVEEVLFARFDRALMRMDWRDFVTGYLVRERGAVHLVAGHDFRFGYRGEGTPQRLKALCAELGLGCDIVPRVELDGVTVSSTYIRSLIAQGEVEEAARFLGHPHVLSGAVIHGRGLGHRMGTPTANLALPEGTLSPAFGVYACKAVLPGGTVRPAVTNVGVRPTVSDARTVSVEPWILDFEGDLYGRTIRLEFHKLLRPERKFASVEELRAAILQNAAETRAYFNR